MAPSSPKVKAEFLITGDEFDPNTVSKELGMAPDEHWIRGAQLEGRTTHQRFSLWEIATDYEDSLDVETQLHSILARLESKRGVLQYLRVTYGLNYTLSIVIRMPVDQAPAVHLGPDCIRFANDIGAEIDIDLYCSILQTTTPAGHEAVNRSPGA